jgi:hypothetical protein
MPFISVGKGTEDFEIHDCVFDAKDILRSFTMRFVNKQGRTGDIHYILKHKDADVESWLKRLRDPGYAIPASVLSVAGAIAGSLGGRAGAAALGTVGAGALQTIDWFLEDYLGPNVKDGYYDADDGTFKAFMDPIYYRHEIYMTKRFA